MDTICQWEKRFRWLFDNATDGFGTPDGWWMPGFEISKEDLALIDKYIDEQRPIGRIDHKGK